MKSNYMVLQTLWRSFVENPCHVEGITFWFNGEQYQVTEHLKGYEPNEESNIKLSKRWTLFEIARRAQERNNSKLLVTEPKYDVYKIEIQN